jgi:hypothetical protein
VSEQQTTLAIVPGPKPDAPPEERVRRPNRGMSHKQNAASRVSQLLTERGLLRRQLVEARQALDAADAEIDKLRDENDLYRRAEEDRLFIVHEKEKAEAQRVSEYLQLCLAAIIECAHDTGAYARHPDFDSRLSRANYLRSHVLECCLQFHKAVAPELVYALACDEASYWKLCGLPTVAIIAMLYPIAMAIQNKFKFERLIA